MIMALNQILLLTYLLI